MTTTSYYSETELRQLGLKRFGQDVRLSRKASLYAPEKIELGDHVRIDDFCILSGHIRIGNFVHIAAYCALYAHESIIIEDYAGLSGRVSIYTLSEDYLGFGMTNPTIPLLYRHPKIAPVRLNRHVIIGAGTVVLPGVTIGEGTAVGALSLVIGSLKPWKVARGNPARPIADRRCERILAYQAELERTRAEPPVSRLKSIAPNSR